METAKKELETEKDGPVTAAEGAACDFKTKIDEEMETAIKEPEWESRTCRNKTADEIYEKKKLALRQALAHHYLTRQFTTMPSSPLMPEVDDKLIKSYLPFNMNKVNKNSTQTAESVDTYESIFYKDNSSHTNIYIQGEAGIGKSTFCTKLVSVWSENVGTNVCRTDNSTNKSNVEPKQIEARIFSDETIIHEFDFVFALALRDLEDECEIENMIQTQIVSELPDHSKYTGLVPKILDKERCLIILDGLDEWSHQRDVCRKSGRTPHRKSWSRTSVITATRPWKMNEVRLKDSEICVLIAITGIADSVTFTQNVLKCLNDQYNTTLDVTDFFKYVRSKRLKHIIDIPVVAMQLVCLWYSSNELGDSNCKIYMNMLDMLFGRAQEKRDTVSDEYADIPKTGLPLCFESTMYMYCEQHTMVLDCLGRLAFYSLHSSTREDSLIFSDSIVKGHVNSTAILKTALTTGILSQQKSPSRITRRSQFSFLHKTFQEFLAAYYIATHVDESEIIVQTLFQVYGQTVEFLDISELFIFVSEMNPEMASKISNLVMESFNARLANDVEMLDATCSYDNYVLAKTESLQRMILAGYKESIMDGRQDPQLALHHVHYSRDLTDFDKIYRDRIVVRNIDKIVTLCAESCALDVVRIQQILAQSSSTLSHVSLDHVKGLTDACLDLFTNITLKYLYLHRIKTHLDIKLNTSRLLYCCLSVIDNEVERTILSALTSAPQLKTLIVGRCKNMSLLCQVLPTLSTLHRLHVYGHIIPASLCQALSTLAQLQRLTVEGYTCEDPSLLCQALSTLSNLQYITLQHTDLCDSDILLPRSIRELVLDEVTLTCRSCRQLVDRLTQIPYQVTCILAFCTVTPAEESDTIMKHIQQSDMFEVHDKGTCRGSIHLTLTKI